MTALSATSSLDVLVIGAGQAGLAAGYYLQSTGLRWLMVDRETRIGASWRRRYDSLVLFTPRAYSALPGLAWPGDPAGYPTKDEQADYLETYARHFQLPLLLGTAIQRLEREGGGFRALTAAGVSLRARAVVLATGAYQSPVVPALARGLAPEVAQFTPLTYRHPDQLPAGARVLVVGDGATGRQIARELAARCAVVLAASGRPEPLPERWLGRSLFWWFDRLGVLTLRPDSLVGRRLRRADSFPGSGLRLPALRQRGVRVLGRLVHAAGRRATMAGGESVEVEAVVWAVGYSDQTDWVAIPEAVDAAGQFIETAGRSPAAGLYFVGRPWQSTQGSARLYGVGADAAALAAALTQHLAAPAAAGGPMMMTRPQGESPH